MGLCQSKVTVIPSEDQKETNNGRLHDLANMLISCNMTDDACLQFLNKRDETVEQIQAYRYPTAMRNRVVLSTTVFDNTLLHLAVSNDKRKTSEKIARRVPDLVFESIDNLKLDNEGFELTPLGIAVATNPKLAIELIKIVSSDPMLRRVITGETPTDTVTSKTELTSNDDTYPIAKSEKEKSKDVKKYPVIPDEGGKHNPEVEGSVNDTPGASGTQSHHKDSTSPSAAGTLSNGTVRYIQLNLPSGSTDRTGKEHVHVTGEDVTSQTYLDNGGSGPDKRSMKSGKFASKDASSVTKGSSKLYKYFPKEENRSSKVDKTSTEENNKSACLCTWISKWPCNCKRKTILGGTILMGQLPLHIAVLSLISQIDVNNDEFEQLMKDTQDTNNDGHKKTIRQQSIPPSTHIKLTKRSPFLRVQPGKSKRLRKTKSAGTNIKKEGKRRPNTRADIDLEDVEDLGQVMNELEKYGASVGDRNYLGDTVFHSILRFVKCFPNKEKAAVKIIEYLIKWRIKDGDTMQAILLAKNNDNVTALQLSVEFGHTKIFHALMSVEDLYYHAVSHFEEVYQIRTIDVSEFDKLTMCQASRRSCQSQGPVPQTERHVGTRPNAQGNSMMKEDPRNKPNAEMAKHRKEVKKNVSSQNTESRPERNDASDGNHVSKENTPERSTKRSYIWEKWHSIKEQSRFNKHQSVIELLCSSPLSTALDMVDDDVFEAIIQRKWPSYCCYFYAAFILHIVLLIWLSVYTIAKAHVIVGDNEFPEAFVRVTQGLMLFVAPVYFLQEMWRCLIARQPLSFQAVHHNVVYRVFTILFSFSLFLDSVSNIFILNNYGLIIAIVLGTWNLLFFLRRFSLFGIYVVLLNEALFTVVFPFAVLAFMQLFIFSVGMHATFLLPENENSTVEQFDKYGRSALNMGKLMVGLTEFDYLLNSKDDFIALLLFGVFILVTFLLIINALVAVMTNRFTEPQKNTVKVQCIQMLSIIVFLEAYGIIGIPVVSDEDMDKYHTRNCPKEESSPMDEKLPLPRIESPKHRKEHTTECQCHGRYVLSYRKVPNSMSDNPKNMVHKLRNRFSNTNYMLEDIRDGQSVHNNVLREVKMLKSSMMKLNRLMEERRSAPQQARTVHIYHFPK